MGIRDLRVLVRFCHAAAAVFAGTTAEFTELFGQQAGQSFRICFLESLVDAHIIEHDGNEGIDESTDAGFATQTLIQGVIASLRMRRQAGKQTDKQSGSGYGFAQAGENIHDRSFL